MRELIPTVLSFSFARQSLLLGTVVRSPDILSDLIVMTHSDGTHGFGVKRLSPVPNGCSRRFQEGGASMTAELFQRIVRVLGFAIP
jgi:hypothetical protein